MKGFTRQFQAFSVAGTLLTAACVSTGTKESEAEVSNNTSVPPAQISPEECVNYVQLKRDADYLCELADGSTRPLKDGERRTTPLTRDEIERVIRINKEDTMLCFETSMPKDANVEGKIYISFEIESDGSVRKSEYNEKRSTYKNKTLGQCLTEKSKKWKFPVFDSEEILQINYPFQLISSEAEQMPEQAEPTPTP